MSKQTEDDIQVIGNGEWLEREVFALAGNGVIAKDGKVEVAIQTHAEHLYLIFTSEQAKVLAEKLAVAVKSLKKDG